MIDEKKLIEAIKDYFKEKIDNIESETIDDRINCILKDNKDICGIIDRQPKVGEWIPCSKKLPDESNYYMACIYNHGVDDFDFRKTWFAHVDDYDMEESEWRELYDFETVTAWMPLPEPYKE